MKKIKMFAAAAMFCAAGFAGYTAYDKATMTDQEKFMLANIEALSQNESYYAVYYCRCHNDGICYSGYIISVRPSCAKMINESGLNIDCSGANGNCV